MNVITKLLFLIKKPRLIIVSENNRPPRSRAVIQILKTRFRVKEVETVNWESILRNQILILASSQAPELGFFIQNSKKTILLLIDSQKTISSQTHKVLKKMRRQDIVVLNLGKERVREVKRKYRVPFFTFGFKEKTDLKISDFQRNTEATNFKINLGGNVVPIWLMQRLERKDVINILSAISVSLQLGFNLIKISQILSSVHLDES